MTWRLIDRCPLSGRETWHTWDVDKKQNVLDYRYPQGLRGASLDIASALRNDTDYKRSGIKKEFMHLAFIPDEVQLKWHAMGVDINDAEEMKKMVQKPEWRYLMVADGTF